MNKNLINKTSLLYLVWSIMNPAIVWLLMFICTFCGPGSSEESRSEQLPAITHCTAIAFCLFQHKTKRWSKYLIVKHWYFSIQYQNHLIRRHWYLKDICFKICSVNWENRLCCEYLIFPLSSFKIFPLKSKLENCTRKIRMQIKFLMITCT